MDVVECVKQGDLEGLKGWVKGRGEGGVRSYLERGESMEVAAHYGHDAIIDYLHGIGCRIDHLGRRAPGEVTPRRPLGLAISRGFRLLRDGDMRGVSTVKLLLEKGANPNHVPHEIDAPLCDSVHVSDDMSITRELIRYGADVDGPDDRSRPVVLAAQSGRVNQLRLLLEAGADPCREGFVPGDTEEEDLDFGTVFDVATGRAKEVLEEWQRAYILAKARRIKDAVVNKGSQSTRAS